MILNVVLKERQGNEQLLKLGRKEMREMNMKNLD